MWVVVGDCCLHIFAAKKQKNKKEKEWKRNKNVCMSIQKEWHIKITTTTTTAIILTMPPTIRQNNNNNKK